MRRKLQPLWILVIMFILTQPCFGQTDLIKHYTLSNETAIDAVTHLSTSTFVPNRTRILGFSVFPTLSNAYSPYAALYDETSTTTHSLNNLFGEAEAGANTSDGEIFAYPKNLSNGLTVALGPYSTITIYYTK